MIGARNESGEACTHRFLVQPCANESGALLLDTEVVAIKMIGTRSDSGKGCTCISPVQPCTVARIREEQKWIQRYLS